MRANYFKEQSNLAGFTINIGTFGPAAQLPAGPHLSPSSRRFLHETKTLFIPILQVRTLKLQEVM